MVSVIRGSMLLYSSQIQVPILIGVPPSIGRIQWIEGEIITKHIPSCEPDLPPIRHAVPVRIRIGGVT